MWSFQVTKNFISVFGAQQFFINQFSTTTSYLVGLKWRQANGYPKNLTSRGVLTDGPDFSYLDGRPTPYTTGQRARILRQREYAQKIKQGLDSIRWAKERYQEKMEEQNSKRKYILGRKLKPKGKFLNERL